MYGIYYTFYYYLYFIWSITFYTTIFHIILSYFTLLYNKIYHNVLNMFKIKCSKVSHRPIFLIYRVESYLIDADLSFFVVCHFSLAILSIIVTFYPQVSSLKRAYDVSTLAIVSFNLRGIECASYAESEHVKASHDSLRVRADNLCLLSYEVS